MSLFHQISANSGQPSNGRPQDNYKAKKERDIIGATREQI